MNLIKMPFDITLIFFLALAFAVTLGVVGGIIYSRRNDELKGIKQSIEKGKKKLKKLKKKAKKLENGGKEGSNSQTQV
jgi:F0F1-type ATP synthase membrane subunit b/b'